MDDVIKLPSTVIVMADDLYMYAWSERGECLGHSGLRMVANHFLTHARLSDLVDVEYELWDWAMTWPGVRASANAWQEFHVSGLILARRLADLLRPLQVAVHYRCHPSVMDWPHVSMGPL